MTKKAEMLFTVENYSEAHILLEEIERSGYQTSQTTYLLGVCELKYKKRYDKAIIYLEKVQNEIRKDQAPIELYNILGDAYFHNYDFVNAKKNYLQYIDVNHKNQGKLDDVKLKVEQCKVATELYNSPVDFKKINLGKLVNSELGDYAPVISADESLLMFTSRRKNNQHTELSFDNEPYEDIYFSTKDKNNEWQKAQLANNNINSIYHDATTAITADGQKLFIYRSAQKSKKGEIYISQLKGKDWQPPTLLSDNINTKDWVTSVSITPDEQTLYFTSNKSGGYGGKDIYISRKDNNGKWQTPENLGGIINTENDEESPFIHPDGVTLYFSSKGHRSMGGYDVFKTVYDGENWSEPENMGYPLNTVEDDLHFVLSANGTNAYYTSTGIDSQGKEDIYQLKMPSSNVSLTMIRGTILCADSLKPLNVNIKVRDEETGEYIKHVFKPNPETGKYLIILPPNKSYDMIITTKGYLPYKMNVFIPDQKEFFELYQTIYLKTVHPTNKKVGQGISVDNTFFNNEGTLIDLEKRKKQEQLRQKQLQDLLNKIIATTDSLSLNNLNEVIDSNFDEKYKTIGVDTSFSSLLNLVNQIIENTDSLALNHVNNIIERGFYTYAEENIFFYGDPQTIRKDTIRVTTNQFSVEQPLNIADSNRYGVGEKNEELQKQSNKDYPNIVHHTVLFNYKSYDIHKNDLKDLSEIIKVCKDYPYLTVLIVGHTDNIGSEQYNLQLSKKRAEAVKRFFIENKIDSQKINVQWKGESDFIDENKTEQGRANNRRVEVKLIENKLNE